ncbi:MAG: purine-nucleoside phosphorylase [Bacteroidales bacterium]|nr:purine-nucleoside phosphorylase [Bacteroidales bacterium]
MYDAILKAAEIIRSRSDLEPATGIVLGTGLGGLVNEIAGQEVIPYNQIPGFPVSTVEGHAGNLILGRIENQPVVVMQGRFHYYEGYTMQEVTFPVRVMKLLGIRQLFLSNAAGGINPGFSTGDLMIIKDHINFFIDNPLRGPNEDKLGPRFPDMTEPYNQRLIHLAFSIAKEEQILLQQGVYVGNPGPAFETPAEYTHYRTIGGDAIGMSTIPEVIVARHMDLPVFAVSVITNLSLPGKVSQNTHQDVQKEATRASKQLNRLFCEMVRQTASFSD